MIAGLISSIVNAAQGISQANSERMINKALENVRADGVADFSSVNRAANRGIGASILTGDIGGVIKLFGQKRALRRQIREARNKYNQDTMNTLMENDNQGLKDGGRVKSKQNEQTPKRKGGKLRGAGGPKDDAIPATLNKGDMVIPAEADSKIVGYILERVGLNKKVDEGSVKQGEGTSVNLSNGETIIPSALVGKAEEAAQELGISLSDLMPNADSTLDEGEGYSNGLARMPGKPGSPVSYLERPSIKAGGINTKPVAPAGGGGLKDGKKVENGGNTDQIAENIGAIIGAGQTIAGGIAALSAGKRPESRESDSMFALANKVGNRKRKLIADIKHSMDESFEIKRRMGQDNAVRLAPSSASAVGSAQEANSEWASDKNVTNKEVAEMEGKVVSEQADLEASAITMKQRELENKQAYYDKKVEAASNLVGAGLNNIIGSVSYKRSRKAMQELAKLRNYDPLLASLNNSK